MLVAGIFKMSRLKHSMKDRQKAHFAGLKIYSPCESVQDGVDPRPGFFILHCWLFVVNPGLRSREDTPWHRFDKQNMRNVVVVLEENPSIVQFAYIDRPDLPDNFSDADEQHVFETIVKGKHTRHSPENVLLRV